MDVGLLRISHIECVDSVSTLSIVTRHKLAQLNFEGSGHATSHDSESTVRRRTLTLMPLLYAGRTKLLTGDGSGLDDFPSRVCPNF